MPVFIAQRKLCDIMIIKRKEREREEEKYVRVKKKEWKTEKDDENERKLWHLIFLHMESL